MTITDRFGKPIGDLPPKAKTIKLDIPAIAQRAAIARSHPMESQRIAAKNLLVEDVEHLLNICVGLHSQNEGLQEQFRGLLEGANNSNVLLALILAQEPEWRWSKEYVAAFEPQGSWELTDDPAAPEHRWLLRMAPPEPIVTADEQTDGDDVARATLENPDEPSGVDAREPVVGVPDDFIGGAGLRIVGDQHDE